MVLYAGHVPIGQNTRAYVVPLLFSRSWFEWEVCWIGLLFSHVRLSKGEVGRVAYDILRVCACPCPRAAVHRLGLLCTRVWGRSWRQRHVHKSKQQQTPTSVFARREKNEKIFFVPIRCSFFYGGDCSTSIPRSKTDMQNRALGKEQQTGSAAREAYHPFSLYKQRVGPLVVSISDAGIRRFVYSSKETRRGTTGAVSLVFLDF